jgi:hypothetical protein
MKMATSPDAQLTAQTQTRGQDVSAATAAAGQQVTRETAAQADARIRAEGAANRSVQMRGQNMTDARARETLTMQQGQGVSEIGGPAQVALVRQFGKAPPNHRWKLDGSGVAEPIPGGPADLNSGEAGAKAAAKKATQVAQAGAVRDTISQAKDLVGINTAGVGSWLTSLPATDARNLAAKLDTIKANLGFDRLQQMRDQSPTGGALGAVAVQELVALQSTVASLDQAQSPGELRKALAKIDTHYENWEKVMRGEMPKKDQTPSRKSGGQVMRFDAQGNPVN